MNLHQLRMEGVLHISPRNPHVLTERWQFDLIFVPLARCLGIRLRYREPADDLEHEIASLLAQVPRIQEALELTVHVKPAVGVSIGFKAKAIWLLALGGIHDGSCIWGRSPTLPPRPPPRLDVTTWIPVINDFPAVSVSQQKD